MADKRSECVSCNDKRIAPGDVDNGEAGNQYHRVRRRPSIGKSWILRLKGSQLSGLNPDRCGVCAKCGFVGCDFAIKGKRGIVV